MPSNTEKLPLNWKGSNKNGKKGQTTNKLGTTLEKFPSKEDLNASSEIEITFTGPLYFFWEITEIK